MEIDDKLASAIHGIESSDSESDFDGKKELDEEYNLLKPPPYDYESIKEKIIVISSEKNYKTNKWQDHLTTVKNNAKIRPYIPSEVMLKPQNKLKEHFEPINQTKKVVASSNIRDSKLINLNKHASQGSISGKLETCSLDHQTIYRQKKAWTIPEIKTKPKPKLEYEFPNLKETYKENCDRTSINNANKAETTDSIMSIGKRCKKKKFKPLQITFFSCEDSSSSHINLRDTQNDVNLRKIGANFDDIESEGNIYNFNFNVVGKQYNSSVDFKRSKHKKGSSLKHEVTHTTRSIRNLVEKCLNKKETRIFQEHRLSSTKSVNIQKDPLINRMYKSTEDLKRVRSKNQRLDPIVLHTEVMNHSWQLPTKGIIKESLNSPRGNKTDRSLIPQKKTPDKLTTKSNITGQSSRNHGISCNEEKVDRTSEYVSKQKEKYEQNADNNYETHTYTKKMDSNMQTKTRPSTTELSTSTPFDELSKDILNAKKTDAVGNYVNCNEICVNSAAVKSSTDTQETKLSSNDSLEEFWDSSSEVSESGEHVKRQSKKISAETADAQLCSIEEGETDTINSDILGKMPKIEIKTRRKRKPKDATKNMAATSPVDKLSQDILGRTKDKKKTETRSQRKTKGKIDQPDTCSGVCQVSSSVETVQDPTGNGHLQDSESLFDEGFKDFISDIVCGGSAIPDLKCFTYNHLIDSCSKHRHKWESTSVQTSEGTAIANLNCFTYDHLIDSCSKYRQKQESTSAQTSGTTVKKNKSVLKKNLIRKRKEINQLIRELTFNLDRDIDLDIEVFSIIIALGTVCYDYGIIKGSSRLEYLFEKFKLDFAYANHVVPADLSPLQYKLLYEHYISYLRYKSQHADKGVVVDSLPADDLLCKEEGNVVPNCSTHDLDTSTSTASNINLNDSLICDILRNDNLKPKTYFLGSLFTMIQEELKVICWQCGWQFLEDLVLYGVLDV